MAHSKILYRCLALLLVVTLGASSVLPLSDSGLLTLSRRQADEEFPDGTPQCEPSCQVGRCGGGVCSADPFLLRRDFVPVLSPLAARGWDWNEINATLEASENPLVKRVFGMPPGNPNYVARPTNAQIAAYLPFTFNGGENAYFGAPFPIVSGAAEGGPDERAYSQQKVFGDQPFQIMSGGLHGCTVAALISQRAVWMAHFWETYSHGKDEKDTTDDSDYQAFRQRVIDFMEGNDVLNPIPNGYKAYIPSTGPPIDWNLFNGDNDKTQIYIMTPVRDGHSASENKFQYGNRVQTIVDAVSHVIPGRSKGRIYPYKRLRYQIPAEFAQVNTNQRGMALFQYDPNSNGQGQRGWRLFFENSRVDGKV